MHLAACTDDELGDEETHLGRTVLFRLVRASFPSGTSFPRDGLEIISRLPPDQLLSPAGEAGGGGRYAWQFSATVNCFFGYVIHSMENGESVMRAILEAVDYSHNADRRARVLDIISVYAFGPRHERYLRHFLEYTPVTAEALFPRMIDRINSVEGFPDAVSYYALMQLESYLSQTDIVQLLSLELANCRRPHITSELIGMVSPASRLATVKVSVMNGCPISVVFRACLVDDMNVLDLILPLLSQEELEMQDEEYGETILFAAITNSVSLEVLDAVCNATTPAFRQYSNSKGQTALDAFVRRPHGLPIGDVREHVLGLLSPATPKNAQIQ